MNQSILTTSHSKLSRIIRKGNGVCSSGKSNPMLGFIPAWRDEKPERVSHGTAEQIYGKDFKNRTDVPYFDYKDFKNLQRYVNQYGQIERARKIGLTESQQRQLSKSYQACTPSHYYHLLHQN